jgi:hypothetical protein
VFREAHGVARPRHHAPLTGRPLDDLQERGRDLEEVATNIKNRLQWVELRDAIPRPAAELHVQVGLQASPHPGH